MLPALLSLALLSAAAGRSPAAEASPPPAVATAAEALEIVHAVRIEAEDPGRLAPLVPVDVGEPLDREAVRRGVELIFATGRFEDVAVDLERGGSGGVDVVFRPRPAPLLRSVEVAGDRVLSPGRIARITRLRPGEALWPARLERAARDVALALVARGHLEALVEPEAVRVPGGADARFRVRAGPRVHVGEARVEGPAVAGVALEPLLRPRPAEIYRKDKADAAAEKMRRQLVAAGRWRASVQLRETYDPAQATMRLVFHVEPGPRLSLLARGAEISERLLAQVRALVRDGGATSDALEAGAERIESQLRAQGHRDAQVRSLVEPQPDGEAIVYELTAGARAVASSVLLRGADAALLEGLRTRTGRPVEDAALEEDARTLVARLEALGHFEARVETDVPDGGGALAVVFVARPGPRADVASFDVSGPPLPSAAGERGPEELAIRVGQPYRLADVARSRDTLLAAWRRVGYLDVRVRPEVVLSEARDEARVRIVVEPGERTLVAQVVLAGLRQTRDAAVEREMVLRPGEPFSFERVLESQRRLSALGIFERVSIAELDPGRERRDLVVNVQEAPAHHRVLGRRLLGAGPAARQRRADAPQPRRPRPHRLGVRARQLPRQPLPAEPARAVAVRAQARLVRDRLLGGGVPHQLRLQPHGRHAAGRAQPRHAHQPDPALPAAGHRRLQRRGPDRGDRPPVPNLHGLGALGLAGVRHPRRPARAEARAVPQRRRPALADGARRRELPAQLPAGRERAPAAARPRARAVRPARARRHLRGRRRPCCRCPSASSPAATTGRAGSATTVSGRRCWGPTASSTRPAATRWCSAARSSATTSARAFQLASFLDLGNVYLEVQRHRPRRAAAKRRAWALRYRTPIGPVRLDWGYVLDHQPGEPRSRFHLTIGYAF